MESARDSIVLHWPKARSVPHVPHVCMCVCRCAHTPWPAARQELELEHRSGNRLTRSTYAPHTRLPPTQMGPIIADNLWTYVHIRQQKSWDKWHTQTQLPSHVRLGLDTYKRVYLHMAYAMDSSWRVDGGLFIWYLNASRAGADRVEVHPRTQLSTHN